MALRKESVDEEPTPISLIPGQIVMDNITDLMPGHNSQKFNKVNGKWEKYIKDSNVTHPRILQSIRDHIKNRPQLKWGEILHEIRSGNKHARFQVSAIGTLAIVIASVGLELGPRHGEDIHKLLDLLHPKEKPKE